MVATCVLFILLPTDPGVVCGTFALWGLGAPFMVLYTFLAVVAVAHSSMSLRRLRAHRCRGEQGDSHALSDSPSFCPRACCGHGASPGFDPGGRMTDSELVVGNDSSSDSTVGEAIRGASREWSILACVSEDVPR